MSDVDLVMQARQGDQAAFGELVERHQLMMILESGRAKIAAQPADPVGDRQVTWR